MNIEELELSLRSEFEGQMNNVVARLRQDVTDFQKRFEAEFQRHREEMDRSLDELASRAPESFPLEAAFTSTITEHLRLARDEGAQIAATAFGEAEKLRNDSAPAAPAAEGKFDLVRDAINDITSKRTQAAILSALVEHASHFAPRGAFFIVKNDNFVGWKAFGVGAPVSEETVRDIHFTTKCHSTLSDAVGMLATVRSEFGSYADDFNFLDPLGFGHPAEMYAVPLSARGRGVAVLYADRDSEGSVLNVEALETLVRVAGLTVELLAAQSSKPQPAEAKAETTTAYSPEPAAVEERTESHQAYEVQAAVSENKAEDSIEPDSNESADAAHEEESKTEEAPVEESTPAVSYEFESNSTAYEVDASTATYEFESNGAYEFEATSASAYETGESTEPAVETVTESTADEAPSMEPAAFEPVQTDSSTEFEFASNDAYDATVKVEAVEAEVPHVEFAAEEVSVVSNGYVAEPVVAPVQPEPVVEAAPAQAVKPRLSDRNVDLPIEVADEERKLHNDARRFARLLVSEIKLYNEQRVTEGRDNNDLYDRLREAIDRSREMYDKRVKPAVASKFDYFHYELVNGLAEGDVKKLGSSYPGPTV